MQIRSETWAWRHRWRRENNKITGPLGQVKAGLQTSCKSGAGPKPRGLQPTDRDSRNGAQGRNRTTDTRIFSPLLYQLSYLGSGAKMTDGLIEEIGPAVQRRAPG